MAVASGSFPSARVLPAMAAGALASMVVFVVLTAGEDVLVNHARLAEYETILLWPGLAVWFFFLIGIATVGLPVWFVLHRRGWMRRWQAALLGGAEAATAGALLTLLPYWTMLPFADPTRAGKPIAEGHLTSLGNAWMITAFFALAGMAGGWTIQRIAYRGVG
jgi:hypothetical protein